MATGMHAHARRLLLAIVVAGFVLVASIYGPVTLDNALGVEIGAQAYAAHSSGGGD